MTVARKLWRKQMAALTLRNSPDLQMQYAGGALCSGRCTDGELIIELEREFFLNRKQSTKILEDAKNVKNTYI